MQQIGFKQLFLPKLLAFITSNEEQKNFYENLIFSKICFNSTQILKLVDKNFR